jgi:hypothetical protein
MGRFFKKRSTDYFQNGGKVPNRFEQEVEKHYLVF